MDLSRCVSHLMLPDAIGRRIVDWNLFSREVTRLVAMSDADLARVAEVCLRNLCRAEDPDDGSADSWLRIVIAPELCDRIQPGSRQRLRRISSTIAEYDPDLDRPFFFRVLSPEDAREHRRSLLRVAGSVRGILAWVAGLDASGLVDLARLAVAGSRAADRWSPESMVYEPAFAYRVVPVLALRVLGEQRGVEASGRDASTSASCREEIPG